MIKVANSKPKLVFREAWNDMGHFFPSQWEVNGGTEFLLHDEFYEKLMEFTDPSLMDYKGPEVGSLEELLTSQFGTRMARAIKLNPSGTQLWQFNALTTKFPKELEYVRMIAVLGERQFYFMTPWDRLKMPFLRTIAYVLNRLRAPKVAKECANWQQAVAQLGEKNDRH